MTIRVDVLDAAHTKQDELADFERVTYTRSAVGPGRFVIACADSRAARFLLNTAGSEILVTDNGIQVFGGPITEWELADDGTGLMYRFSGVNWAGMLAWRWTDPEPGTATPPFSTDAYDTYTGQVGIVIGLMVDDRCGTAAQAGRQFLTVGNTYSGPTSITQKLRFRANLAEIVEQLAIAYGLNVGVELNTATNGLVFTDSVALLKPDATIGNVSAASFNWHASGRAPAATHVIVGGQGELTARTFSLRSRTASARWPWRIETFQQHTEIDNQADLDEAGDRHLEELADQLTFTADIAAFETDTIRFGRDFQLGDIVPLHIAGLSQNVRIMQVQTDVTDTVNRTLTVGIPRPSDIALAIAEATRADRTARQLQGQ